VTVSLRLDSSARLTIGIAKLCIIRRVGVLTMQYVVLATKLVYSLIRPQGWSLPIGITKLCIIPRVGVVTMLYVLATKLVYSLISYCTHMKRQSSIFRNVDHCQVSCIKLRHCLPLSYWRVFMHKVTFRSTFFHLITPIVWWKNPYMARKLDKYYVRIHILTYFVPAK
jgi:hypothetical protein